MTILGYGLWLGLDVDCGCFGPDDPEGRAYHSLRPALFRVIYCGFVKCTRSHNGAAWAMKLGYKNVYRYPGGIFAWKGAGYQMEK